MGLIKEVEIAYFRSFYKISLDNCADLNVIFGKNDAGKSNIVRALNLFFNQNTDVENVFRFDIDFSDSRLAESEASDDIRKFVYVKVTFNTPSNYQKSLGKSFYVKRQWTVSRGEEFVEEFSSSISKSSAHIVRRFLNLINYMYIPAIKDIKIFEYLLGRIYETISTSEDFGASLAQFAERVQASTSELFANLPSEIAYETKIAAPRRMDELFQTLDFETRSASGAQVKSLTLQRGDGIKARHIPELLRFLADRDGYQHHIWGFEEPENSLDFISSEAEARRFLSITQESSVQLFLTTHSPSFYNLDGDGISKFYVRRSESGVSEIVQGKALKKLDINAAIGEGFYLPAVASALEQYSAQAKNLSLLKDELVDLQSEIANAKMPVVLTEGITDKAILDEAWGRLRKTAQPFVVKSCDTQDGVDGGAGGAEKLSLCLKAVRSDSPHLVIGIFDRDKEGIKGFSLDANFAVASLVDDSKSNKHGKSFGILLPVRAGREDFAKAENLPIEFMFDDETLATKVNGAGLETELMKRELKVGDMVVSPLTVDHLWARQVVSGTKKHFAENVVPALPDGAFTAFEPLFAKIEEIVASEKNK